MSDISKALSGSLEFLLKLESNWSSYGSEKITKESVRAADTFFNVVSVVPTDDGGVQLEWHVLGVGLEVRISPEGSVSGIDCESQGGFHVA